MDIIELVIDDSHEALAIDAVSLVEFPAIESEWIFMSKQDNNNLSLAKVDEHKRLIIGAALIPNKQIYRRDENGKEFYVFFSADTVKRASELYLKNNIYLNKYKINHRDIKPNNILVKNKKSLDKIMLADFGLSKQIECDYANLSSKYGCPTFVAPEIVNYKQLKKNAEFDELNKSQEIIFKKKNTNA